MMKTKKNTYVSTYVGCKIHAARKALNISAAELGHRIGVSQQQISCYESGKTPITIDTLVLIAKVLGVPVVKLLPDNYVKSKSDREFAGKYFV